MKGEQPSLLFSPLSLYLTFSPVPSLPQPLSPLPSPRGPRVALPRGLASNHPQLVGGNRRLPAGCLVTADPWDTHTHTHTFLHTQAKHTHTHNLIYAYQGICCYLLASLHPRLPHNSILPRPLPHHVNWITGGGLPQGRAKSLASPLLQASLNWYQRSQIMLNFLFGCQLENVNMLKC